MHPVTQSILQAVEFTYGFPAKSRIAWASSAQHVTQLELLVLGSYGAAELHVSVGFPPVIILSLGE